MRFATQTMLHVVLCLGGVGGLQHGPCYVWSCVWVGVGWSWVYNTDSVTCSLSVGFQQIALRAILSV